MLTRTELVNRMVDLGAGDRRHVSNMLNALREVAVEEIERGENFVVPGIAKISYNYRKPMKKGERWRKGDEVTGFGGITSVKEEDSPPVARKITLKASPTGAVAKLRPGSKPEAQKEFFATKTAKAVVKRKS